MEQDPKTYYIENVAILPGYRGEKGFSQVFGVLREEYERRGIFTISLHARVSNNLSKNIQKNMKIIKVRNSSGGIITIRNQQTTLRPHGRLIPARKRRLP